MSGEKISKRQYAKIAGATLAGVIIGAVAGWYGKPEKREEILEKIMTTTVTHFQTVTQKETVATKTETGVTGKVPTLEEVQRWYKEKAAPYKGVTLKYTIENNSITLYTSTLLHEFSELTGIKLEEEQATHTGCYEKKLLDLERKTGVYDIHHDENDWIGTWDRRGWTVSIDKFLDEHPELVSPWLDRDDIFVMPMIVNRKGEWVATPNYGIPSFYVYRTDLFNDPKEKEDFKKKYGWDLRVPTSNDEYAQIAEFFYRPNVPLYGHHTFYKFAGYMWHHFLAADSGACSDGPLPFPRPVDNWGLGVNEEGWACYASVEKGGMIDSQATIDGLNFMKDMLKYAPPGAVTHDWTPQHETFATGTIAQMYFAFPHFMPVWQDPSKSSIVGKIGFALCPVNTKYWKPGMPRTYIDHEGLAFSPYCRYPEAAWLAMQYCIEKPNDVRRALNAGCAMRTSTLYHPELEALWRKKDGGESWINYLNYWRNPDNMKYFAGTDPAIGEYGAINEIWDKWFYKVYVGELEAKDAVREAARELDAKFHELGYW